MNECCDYRGIFIFNFIKQFVVIRGHLRILKVDYDALKTLNGLDNDRKYINRLFDLIFTNSWLNGVENSSTSALLAELGKLKEYLTMKGNTANYVYINESVSQRTNFFRNICTSRQCRRWRGCWKKNQIFRLSDS